MLLKEDDKVKTIRNLFNAARRGQTMTEYALIMAGVVIVAWAGYVALGPVVLAKINEVVAALGG